MQLITTCSKCNSRFAWDNKSFPNSIAMPSCPECGHNNEAGKQVVIDKVTLFYEHYADTLAEVEKHILRQIDEELEQRRNTDDRWTVLSVRGYDEVWSRKGGLNTMNYIADTDSKALDLAKRETKEDNVIKMKIKRPASNKTLNVEGFVQSDAENKLSQNLEIKPFKLESIRLAKKGNKGIWGLWRKPNKYDAQILLEAIVEVTVKNKASMKASVTLGKTVGQLIRLSDVQKVLDKTVQKLVTDDPNIGRDLARNLVMTNVQIYCALCGRLPEDLAEVLQVDWHNVLKQVDRVSFGGSSVKSAAGGRCPKCGEQYGCVVFPNKW
jgi:hypothetical protein